MDSPGSWDSVISTTSGDVSGRHVLSWRIKEVRFEHHVVWMFEVKSSFTGACRHLN